MKACLGGLARLSRRELEAIRAGEGDPQECEVEGAALILAMMDHQMASSATDPSTQGSMPVARENNSESPPPSGQA